jgi:hypothetical protein
MTRRRRLQKMITKTLSWRKKLKVKPNEKRWKKIGVHSHAPSLQALEWWQIMTSSRRVRGYELEEVFHITP